MSKKTTQSSDPDDKQPWAAQFDDDRDDSGKLSRVAAKKKRQGNSTLTWVVSILLIAVIIGPILLHVLGQNSSGSGSTTDKIMVETSSKSSSDKISSEKSSSKAKHSSAKSDKASSKEASSSTSVASSSAAQSSVAPVQSSSAVASSSSTPVASSSSVTASSSSVQASGTYTVQAGDNAYRIAVNHGMTLAELYALNGLGSGATISPGMTLKVK